jgi:hypothetical protein
LPTSINAIIDGVYTFVAVVATKGDLNTIAGEFFGNYSL